MLKRVISLVLCIFLIFVMAVNVSAEEIPLYGRLNSACPIFVALGSDYGLPQSSDWEYFQISELPYSTSFDSAYDVYIMPFLSYTEIIYETGTPGPRYQFMEGYTYNLSYQFRYKEDSDPNQYFISLVDNDIRYFESTTGLTHSTSSIIEFMDGFGSLSSLIGQENISMSMTFSDSICTVDMLFNMTASSASCYYLSPYLRVRCQDFKFISCDGVGFYDINKTGFESLVEDRLDNIIGSIDSGFSQNHADMEEIQSTLDQINDTLVGEPVEDTSGLGDAASDLEDVESDINDKIFAPITLPNGTSIQVDGDTLVSIRDYIYDNYNPQDYEASVGKEISKVFETFIPYIGIVVWLNLALALILGFLRGRANA